MGMYINPLDVPNAACLHPLSLILDTSIANGTCTVVVNLGGHAPVLGSTAPGLQRKCFALITAIDHAQDRGVRGAPASPRVGIA